VLPRSMVLDISTLFVAARAMGRVLFIIGVGSAAAQSGLLDKPARSCLANFNLNLFFPALYISVAGHYGAYDLIRYAPLWIGSLLHIALGYGLALVTARLFGLQQQDKTFVLIMTAFGNCGGLPFVLMQAVCSSSWERVADMHEPVARAFVMMCARRPCARRAQPLPLPCRSRRPAPSRRQLYNVPWTLVAFTLGKATVERAATEPMLPLVARDSAAARGGDGGGGGGDEVGRARRASFNHVEALDTEPPSAFRAPASTGPMPRTLSFEERLAAAAHDAVTPTPTPTLTLTLTPTPSHSPNP